MPLPQPDAGLLVTVTEPDGRTYQFLHVLGTRPERERPRQRRYEVYEIPQSFGRSIEANVEVER